MTPAEQTAAVRARVGEVVALAKATLREGPEWFRAEAIAMGNPGLLAATVEITAQMASPVQVLALCRLTLSVLDRAEATMERHPRDLHDFRADTCFGCYDDEWPCRDALAARDAIGDAWKAWCAP